MKLLAILLVGLLTTPALAHHEGGGAGGGRSPGGSAANHCVGDGTTREGAICTTGQTPDHCVGTCTTGWCGTAGDSKPCTADSDCDGTCSAIAWGHDYGHTDTCTGSTCDDGYATCANAAACADPLVEQMGYDSADPGFIHYSTDATNGHPHCYSDTPGRMSITDDKLQYCDADGVKRTVLHGYQPSATGVDARGNSTGQMGHFGFSGTQSGGLTRYSPFDAGWLNFGTLPSNHLQVHQPVMVGSGATGIEIQEICCHAYNLPIQASYARILLYSGGCTTGTISTDAWFYLHETNAGSDMTYCVDSSTANGWASPQIPDGDCALWGIITNGSGTSAEKKMEDLSCTFRYSVY